MAQRIRFDEPGAWLHVMNRGLARRTLFENRADFRHFLACLARAVREGWIEVHAYSLLGTHFHLLLRSPKGEAWRGLRRAQNAYSRRFNIRRRRDGPLFRGRFRSKRVWSEAYWWTVLRYIDQNPVLARLAAAPEAWPWGSAFHYCQAKTPPWLSRSVVEERVTAGGLVPFTAEAYREALGAPLGEAQRRLVEVALERFETNDDPVGDLVGAAPSRVHAWMLRKAALADGTAPGLPVVAPETLVAALDGLCPTGSPSCRRDGDVRRRARDALCAGLLRTACGIGYQEIAARLGCSTSGSHGLARRCARLVVTEPHLAALAADALQEALRRDWPTRGPRSGKVPAP